MNMKPIPITIYKWNGRWTVNFCMSGWLKEFDSWASAIECALKHAYATGETV